MIAPFNLYVLTRTLALQILIATQIACWMAMKNSKVLIDSRQHTRNRMYLVAATAIIVVLFHFK